MVSVNEKISDRNNKIKDVINLNERKRKYRIFLCCCLVAAFVGMGFLIYETAKEDVPDEIHVYANQQINWEEIFQNPLLRDRKSVV